MRLIIAYARATVAFLKSLFRPRAKRTGLSPNGHAILEGWDSSPEESLIKRARALSMKNHPEAKLALFGVAGPHGGELIALGNRSQRLGADVTAQVVITPREECASRELLPSYRVLLNDMVLLTSDGGAPFHLNGMPLDRSELFDYDELELAGNKFLVLAVGTSGGSR